MAILFDILVNAVDNQIYMQSGDSVEQGEAECIRYAHALFIEFKRQLETSHGARDSIIKLQINDSKLVGPEGNHFINFFALERFVDF